MQAAPGTDGGRSRTPRGEQRSCRCVLLPLLRAEPRRAAASNDLFTCPIFLPLRSRADKHLVEPRFHLLNHRDMDARKKSPPTPASAGAGAGAAPAAVAANEYFSSVFSSSPAANARDARQTDLYTILNKQNPKGHNGGGIADSKSQGSPNKGHAVCKDEKHFYPNESSESPYFGSSVHYGGRDFYDSSPHKQANESSRNYKEDNLDGSLATRGDWWQGSLYY